MKIDKKSLGFRLLLPIFVAVTIVSVLLLVAISYITHNILDNYFRFTLATHAAETKRILDAALAELTTARLLDNRTVVEIKQRTVIEAISRHWKARGIGGVIVGPDGRALLTTFTPIVTRRILNLPADGLFHLDDEQGHLLGMGMPSSLWGWRVITVARNVTDESSRREVLFLAPLVLLSFFIMTAALFIILQQRLRRPVAAMISSIGTEQEVGRSGVTELDQIGSAINDSMKRVRERTEAVREKEERIRLLLDSMAEAIYGIDLNGICTFCNPVCVRLLGHVREENLLGKNIHGLIHHTYPDGRPYPDDACKIYDAYRKGVRVYVDDEVFWRFDGTSFPVEYWSNPVVERGRIVGAVVTFLDITERRKSEEFIRNILETVDEGFLVIDRDFTVLSANRAYSRQTGIPLEAIIGKKCHEIAHGSVDPCADEVVGCSARKTFETGEPCSGVHLHGRKGEAELKIEIKSYPVQDRTGRVASVILTTTDITEKSRLEQQLNQAQKMEAVGQLAGGIAHDFNNVLTAIVGYASLLKKTAQPGSQDLHYVEQILGSAQRAANLTRQILAFSRKQVLMPRPVNLNTMVRGMERMIMRLLGEDIEIRTALATPDVTVMADLGQLEQVLMNLCTNARDAMPNGGKLVIGTDMVALDHEVAAKYGLIPSERYALLAITDTGTGMDAQTQERIFEPFFTTKEMGRGTGLGLSIVYGIVKQHQGHITVASEPEKGTTFNIYLPLTGQAEQQRPLSSEVAVRGGTETILIAEDNDEVRQYARHVLQEQGYRVITAADGEEAVRQFQANGDAIQLCLFDLIMPKKNGREAIEEIRTLRKDVKVVFMSGYTADVIRIRDIIQKDTVFLAKPILPQDLLRTVRNVLDA